ncbi:MAG: hypothetical protein JNL13_13990 [Chitinophagaceae bacterium]|nr:hypothetical protein [Chitinophagaceae bacterium]
MNKRITWWEILFFCFVVFLSPLKSKACDCFIIPSFFYYFNNSDRVFAGKVLSIKDSAIEDWNTSVSIKFKITEHYKGDANEDTILMFTSGFGAGSCGQVVQEGDVWILFSSNSSISKCEPNFLVERAGKSINQYHLDYYDKIDLRAQLGKIKARQSYPVNECDTQKKCSAQGTLKNGLADGLWTYAYKTYNGPGVEETIYRNGEPQLICYYHNGKLEREEWWSNGKRDGNESIFYKEGALKFRSVTNKAGRRTETGFYKDGSVRFISVFQGEEKSHHQNYYKNQKVVDLHFYDDSGALFRLILKEGQPSQRIKVED